MTQLNAGAIVRLGAAGRIGARATALGAYTVDTIVCAPSKGALHIDIFFGHLMF